MKYFSFSVKVIVMNWNQQPNTNNQIPTGHLHPITQTIREIYSIFYNFDALNIPADHPSRDMQQKDLLLPWRTVLDNVILGLELKGVIKSEARQKAIEHIETFGLKGFENQYPFVLSGGMRQRAQFLRSVLLYQEVMLLDEPFGALDALTRHQMQEWLSNLWRTLGNTIILVTHDTDEALLLSDKIYVMSARPAKIVMSLDVDLPRPRTHATVTEPEFAKLKAKLLAQLHEKQPATI